jgi:putative membrane protein
MPTLSHFDLFVPQWELPAASNTTQGGWLLGVDENTVAILLERGELPTDTLSFNQATRSYGPVGDWVTGLHTWRIDPWVMGCGCAAAIAMLLPGISGSYLLTILGLYGPAMAALTHLLHGDPGGWDALTLLANLAVGILAGLAIGARAIRWLLTRYRGWAMAALTGFMVGALRSIWPWWTTAVAIDPLHPNTTVLQLIAPIWPSWNDGAVYGALLCAIAGGFLVWAIEVTARRRTIPV